MSRWAILLGIAMLLTLSIPTRCPAPLVYRPGEGWTYEPVGGSKWERTRAADQMDVAETSFEKKDYFVAQKAARRVVKHWPLSDYAPRAQYLLARCLEERKMDERAFHQYQLLLDKYPKYEGYNEVVERQLMIANRFLAGQWFKLWGYIPIGSSMDRTAKLYEQIVKKAPYHETVGPQAQMSIGTARENQKNYLKASKAYELAADRYSDRPRVASEALWKAGEANRKQSAEAEYDQGASVRAIETYNDFIALFPEDSRVPQARDNIIELRTEQARGSFIVAKFYEKYHRYQSALIYYNEVLIKDPDSPYAPDARERMEVLKKRIAEREAAKQKSSE
ncbi:MAG: outer membrane protein assembly factor BamD [Verrucomicrobia bacterium]|nr:outer membrane protein assembly factor BamD [Verrucomicrobiota bacterium]